MLCNFFWNQPKTIVITNNLANLAYLTFLHVPNLSKETAMDIQFKAWRALAAQRAAHTKPLPTPMSLKKHQRLKEPLFYVSNPKADTLCLYVCMYVCIMYAYIYIYICMYLRHISSYLYIYILTIFQWIHQWSCSMSRFWDNLHKQLFRQSPHPT